MVQIDRWPEEDSDMGRAFAIKGMVRLDQFDFEVSQAHGWENAALVAEGTMGEASPEHPVLLFVGQTDCNDEKVIAAGLAHVPNPDWYSTVSYPGITFDEVAQKAVSGGSLSSEEIQVAIRGLILLVQAGS